MITQKHAPRNKKNKGKPSKIVETSIEKKRYNLTAAKTFDSWPRDTVRYSIYMHRHRLYMMCSYSVVVPLRSAGGPCIMPVKSLDSDGINQCGSARSSAGGRYIMPVLLTGDYYSNHDVR